MLQPVSGPRPLPKAPVVARPVALPTPVAAAAPQGDGAFTWGEALKSFGKGVLHPVTSLIDGFKRDPVKTTIFAVGGALALGAFTLAMPVVLPAIGLGAVVPFVAPALSIGTASVFGTLGALKIVSGGQAARQLAEQGEYDAAERAFETIGQGTFDVVTSAISLFQGVKALRGALEARRAAEAARVTVAAAPQPAVAPVVTELDRQKAALATLQKRVASLAPGAKLSASGEAAIASHLKWLFQDGRKGPLSEAKIAKVLSLMNEAAPDSQKVLAAMQEGASAYQQREIAMAYHYTFRHLTQLRTQDLLGVTGAGIAYPLHQLLKQGPAAPLSDALKWAPGTHPGADVLQNAVYAFETAISTGNVDFAKKLLAMAKAVSP